MKIRIGKRTIAPGARPYVIAEAGVNFYDTARVEKISPMAAAKKMIREAARAGADAIKFQTYKAERLASRYSPAYWDTSMEKTRSQLELFRKFDKFGAREYRELAAYCKKAGIIFMSTPFDLDAVDLLAPLVPAFKIASADITNTPLLLKVARTKKPVILSTGASTTGEIQEAVSLLNRAGNRRVIILHCVLNYPTQNENANLKSISYLARMFPRNLIGYSDHTRPDKTMTVVTAAVLLGATIVEKHFTLDKSLSGNDHYHAMDPADLRTFSSNLDLLEKVLGREERVVLPSERISRKFARRSLVAARAIRKGERMAANLIEVKRPGTGIPPASIVKILGKKAVRPIKEDEILQYRFFK